MTRDLVTHTVGFCRALRDRGLAVTPAESALAARALDVIDIADEEDLRLALRTALVGRREEYPLFDEAFHDFWRAHDETAPPPIAGRSHTKTTRPPEAKKSAVTLSSWMRPAEALDEAPISIKAASDRETLAGRDFSTFGDAQCDAFRRLAARLARRLALRRSRRWRPTRRGTRMDLRRTLRQSLRTGGDAITLVRRARRIRRTRLVALCDVSGSMELYARFLLQFLHALQNSFARVETFVFSTRLTRTTGLLKGADWSRALTGLARDVTDWSGGTRIGASLGTFVDRWLRLVDRRTIVLVLSDGWETGDPAVLSAALAAMHARAGKVIWLNPLMASADFAPESRGMIAALPHVDLLAPVHDLASLERLVREFAI